MLIKPTRRGLVKHHAGRPISTRGSSLDPVAEKRVRELGRGRYRPEDIAKAVDRLRIDKGLSVKEVAMQVWPQQGDGARHTWSKKTARRGSDWTFEEIGVVADVLNAPPGWPFLSDDMTRLLMELVKLGRK